MLNFIYPTYARKAHRTRCLLSLIVLCIAILSMGWLSSREKMNTLPTEIYAVVEPVPELPSKEFLKFEENEPEITVVSAPAEQEPTEKHVNPCEALNPPKTRILASVFHTATPYLVIQSDQGHAHKLHPSDHLGSTEWALQHLESEQVIWRHLPSNCREISSISELATGPEIHRGG